MKQEHQRELRRIVEACNVVLETMPVAQAVAKERAIEFKRVQYVKRCGDKFIVTGNRNLNPSPLQDLEL